jgi:predicted MFS family arabinose efflux permease
MSKTALVSTKKHIRSSFRDATFTNLNIGMAESYFCAFMLALGISDIISGLGTVIPQFIGVLFQLLSIRSFFRQYSLKNRILLFLAIQALSMIPLIMIGQLKINSAFLTISILGVYWGSLLSLNPPWNRLIGHTVPEKFRLKFFSIRSQFAQFAVFLGLITSGLLLYWAKGKNLELQVFVGIFIFGFLLKLMSWFEIKRFHNDYDLAPGSEHRVRLRDFLRSIRSTDQGKLIIFLFFFYITVHFSAPYFNPYMLGKLKFNYLEYMIITSVAYFGRVFAYKLIQNRAKSRHINKLLIFSTLGITTSPLLWALTENYGAILAIEFLSGCYWAGFELSTTLLYYQKIDDRERTSIITYITFLNTTGMVIGSSLGACFMAILPPDANRYIILFAGSTLLRALVIAFAPHVNFKGRLPKLAGLNRFLDMIPSASNLIRPFTWKKKSKNSRKEKE